MTTVNVEPTLFIFLGTSSSEVGWRLKKLVDTTYGELPIFRYLWVDTDSNIGQNQLEWLRSSYVERADIGNYNASTVIKYIDNYPHIKTWWPIDSKLKAGYLGRGAKQIRLIGRLSLFRMFTESSRDPTGSFYSKLTHSISEISSVENKQQTRDKQTGDLRFVINEDHARVFIIFSTCGGTGSGIAFDVAYLCRNIFIENGINPTLSGVAILPPVIEKAMREADLQQKNKIKANSYAWFKENDFLTKNQTWNVSYPDITLENVQNVPFDVNFVVDISNQRGQFLNSEQDTFKLIAQTLFLITGTSLAGNVDSIRDNMGVTNDSFKFNGQECLRSYSSFATAALIFPKERIENYCGAKLAEDVLRKVCVVPKQLDQNQIDSSTLINQCGLSYQKLLDEIIGTKHVRNDNLEFIQAAALPGEALTKITDEITNDQIELSELLNLMKADEKRIKNERKLLLRSRLLELLRSEGPGYLCFILNKLTEDSSAKSPTSITGNKKALIQFGISQDAINTAKLELEESKKEIADLTDSFSSLAGKALFPRQWKEKFRKAKNKCISAMENVNNCILRNYAELSIRSIYDELLGDIQELRNIVNNLLDTFTQSAEQLKSEAERFLTIPSTQLNLFELTNEAVDQEYIKEYFEQNSANVDRLSLYNHFINQQANLDFQFLSSWNKTLIANAISSSAAEVFAPALQEISILEAMQAYYGDKYSEVVKNKLDGLTEYCQPFWRYAIDAGLDPAPQGPSFIGLMDADSPLLPKAYKDHARYQGVSVGLKDAIYLVKILHGVPSCLLTGMAQWKQQYEMFRENSIDPLHIFPEAKDAEEVIPEMDSLSRSVFAYAMAFGYITKRSTHYYYDSAKRYSDINVRPDPSHKIAEGRANAESVFIQHKDWVDEVNKLVDQEIQKIGNERAITFINGKIKELNNELDSLEPKSPSRDQLKKEIKALENLVGQLKS